MTTRITLQFNDRDGNLGQCSTWNTGLNAIADLVAEANVYGSRVSAISDAALVGATLSRRVSVFIPSSNNTASNVRRSLLLMGRSSTDRYASIVVPSARLDLPYDTAGPYAGIRIVNAAFSTAILSRRGVRSYLLSGMVRPDGEIVIPQELIGGLLLNKE